MVKGTLIVAATQLQLLVVLSMISQQIPIFKSKRIDLLLINNGQWDMEEIRKCLAHVNEIDEIYSFDVTIAPRVKFSPSIREMIWMMAKQYDNFWGKSIDSTLLTNQYDSIFCFDDRMLLRLKRSRMLQGAKVYCFDEGTSSYIAKHLLTRHKIANYTALYSYNPQLVESCKGLSIQLIPEKMGCNSKFLELANKVFPYTNNVSLQSGDIVFFDQPIEDKQLRDWTYSLLIKVARSSKVYVKSHPRSKQSDIDIYKQLGHNIYLLPTSDIPWEVVLLNQPVDKLTLLTVSSTAALSHELYLNLKGNYQAVFLHTLYKKNNPYADIYEVNQDIAALLCRLKEKEVNLHIPETESELFDILYCKQVE